MMTMMTTMITIVPLTISKERIGVTLISDEQGVVMCPGLEAAMDIGQEVAMAPEEKDVMGPG